MPLNVPRGELPGVAPAPLPGVRQRVIQDQTSFGGGPAIDGTFRASQGLAREAQAIALDAHARAEGAMLDSLKQELAQQEYDLKMELSKVKGFDALSASDKALADFDKGVQEIGKRATSERVRQQFSMVAERHRLGLQSFAEPYAQSQVGEWEKEKFEANVQAQEQLAVQAFADPTRIAMALDEQRKDIIGFAQRTGKPREWADLKAGDAASRVHAGVLSQRLASKDYFGASEYFAANKAAINPRLHPHFIEAISQGSLDGEALRLADQIMQGDPELLDLGAGKVIRKDVSLSEAIEKSKDIEDLELRKRTQQELIRMNSIQEAAKRDQSEADIEAAYTAVERREKVPAELLARLSVADRQRIFSLEREILKGMDRKTDEDILLAFHEQTPEERAAMKASDLLFLREKLSNKDYEQARQLILDDKRDAGKPKSGTLSVTDKNAILDTTGLVLESRVGLKGAVSKTTDTMNQAKKVARAAAYAEFSAAVAGAGKRLTTEEQQELFRGISERKAKTLMREVITNKQTVPFLGSDTKKLVGQLREADFEDDDWGIEEDAGKRIDLVSRSVPEWKLLSPSARTIRRNMAYLAIQDGKPEEFISAVLSGVKKWPW